MNKIKTFIEWALKNGWEIKMRQNSDVNITEEVIQRYPEIPNDFLVFLQSIDICITPDEKSWFLCLNEYNGTSELAFRWDEIEKMSLIEGDNTYNDSIIKFWNNHLPIALSVRNGYAYFAIDVGNDFGSIIYSYEPEFEEPEKIASSFNEFLDLLMTNRVEF